MEQANHVLNLILPLIVILGADAWAVYYGNVLRDPEAVALMGAVSVVMHQQRQQHSACMCLSPVFFSCDLALLYR